MQRYGRSRINPNVPDVNTDWYDEIMRIAPIQNHSLSVAGEARKQLIRWVLVISDKKVFWIWKTSMSALPSL